MSWDYINIGSSPHSEECAQLGSPEYHEKATEECQKFAEQIVRHYPPPPYARVRTKWFDHDFGSYAEVVVLYHEDDEKATQYAYMVENDPKNVLQFWDSVTVQE